MNKKYYREVRFRLSEEEYEKVEKWKNENYDSWREMVLNLIETMELIKMSGDNNILQINLENYLSNELEKISDEVGKIEDVKNKLNEIIRVLNNL